MGEAVQHLAAANQRGEGDAVFLLVEEEAGFLPVGDVHQELDAVFFHFNGGGEFAAQEARLLGETFQLAHGHIVALVNAAAAGDVHDRVAENILVAVDAQRQRLHHADIGKFIDDQCGQEVTLAVDQTAGIEVAEVLAVIVGALHAGIEKVPVNRLVLASEHAQRDHGSGIIIRAAEKFAAGGVQINHVAGLGAGFHAVNVAAKNPRMAHFHAAFLGGFEISFRHDVLSSGSVGCGRIFLPVSLLYACKASPHNHFMYIFRIFLEK